MSTATSSLGTAERRLIITRVSLESLIESMKGGNAVERRQVAAQLRAGAEVMEAAAEWMENTGDYGGDAWQTPPPVLRVQKKETDDGRGHTMIEDLLIGAEVRLENVALAAIQAFAIFRKTRRVRVDAMRDARRGLDAAQD